jgi:hypothetical protein
MNPETFVSPSGNQADITFKGVVCRLAAVHATWEFAPSPRDQRRFREWFRENYEGEFDVAHRIRIDSAEAQ